MPLPQALSRVPTSIGLIRIELLDYDGTNERKAIRARADVLDQDGGVILEASWEGDLQPHITPAQKTGLITFIDAIRAKAIEEILP